MPDPAAVEVVPAVYGHGLIRSASSSHHEGVPQPKIRAARTESCGQAGRDD